MELILKIKFDDSFVEELKKQLAQGKKVKIRIENFSGEMVLGNDKAKEVIVYRVKP